ncbi:DsrE/DsrF/DrsH-like family protein [Streptomyces sp. GLT-R25]
MADTATIEKVSIIVSKGSLEGVYPALIMANGARAEGIEADLFFTFFGLDAITKKRWNHIKLATVGNPGLHLPTLLGRPTGCTGPDHATHGTQDAEAGHPFRSTNTPQAARSSTRDWSARRGRPFANRPTRRTGGARGGVTGSAGGGAGRRRSGARRGRGLGQGGL